MRQITIDFDKMLVSGLIDNKYAGYLGEHNATELTLIKPKELEGAAFSVAFMTNGEVVHSKFFNNDEIISVAIWQQLTQDSTLYVQLEAYDRVGDYLGKSNVAKLNLGSSVHGIDVVADADNADVYADISQNTMFREMLEDNLDTLDKLTTSENGKLLFNGNEIEGGNAPVGDYVKPEDLEDYRRKDAVIPSSEVEYINNMLMDETNSVKGALDEAVGYVLGNVPDLVAKKHTHSNKTVLDKFSVGADNSLQFDGKPVASESKDPQENWICEPVLVDDQFVKCVIHGNLTNCISIETDVLPENAKVKKVEIQDLVNGTNDFVSLEDLVKVDPVGVQAPYFVMYPDAQGMFLTSVALVVFPIATNSFYDSAASSAFVGTTVKIYYEIEE